MQAVFRAGATALALAAMQAATGSAVAQTAFAAETSVSTISPCPSFCGGPGGSFDFDPDGGEGFTTSRSSLANADGNGQAEVALTGQVGLPVLRAEAFATTKGSSQVQSSATAMQGFYVGLDGLPEYTLELALSGQATGTVRADLLVFRDADPLSLPTFSTDRGAMQFEIIELSGDLSLVGSLSLPLPASGNAELVQATLEITELAPGDLFYVWARLVATGTNGTFGDAYNTLNLSYTDPTGLSQLAPIPEPGTWALLAAGLAALAWRRRGAAAGRAADIHTGSSAAPAR